MSVQHALNNLDKLVRAQKVIDDLPPEYVVHHCVNPIVPDDNTISIVMTTYNRPEQTKYTLSTINQSGFKNVQIIIIDDYTVDQYNDLARFGLHIDYIRIRNKFWVNPCVNYNIGFRFIKGTKVIIQNAEVCHINDCINYVSTKLQPNQYMVFDVLALSAEQSETMRKSLIPNYYVVANYSASWYQHHTIRNKNYHFLAAMNIDSLKKIGGFDPDYCCGTCYDDDDFVFKIEKNNIEIVNVVSEHTGIMGIHQFHAPNGAHEVKLLNTDLLELKKQYFFTYGIHANFTKSFDDPNNKFPHIGKVLNRVHNINQIPTIMSSYINVKKFSKINTLAIWSFKHHNPSWEIKIYIDYDNPVNNDKNFNSLIYNKVINVIKVNFDDIGFDHKASISLKKDYISYYAMVNTGGVWMDHDVFTIKPITQLLHSEYEIYGDKNNINMIMTHNSHFCNVLMACLPDNPFFKRILECCYSYYKENNPQFLGNNLLINLWPNLASVKNKYPSLNILNLSTKAYMPYTMEGLEQIYYKPQPVLDLIHYGTIGIYLYMFSFEYDEYITNHKYQTVGNYEMNRMIINYNTVYLRDTYNVNQIVIVGSETKIGTQLIKSLPTEYAVVPVTSDNIKFDKHNNLLIINCTLYEDNIMEIIKDTNSKIINIIDANIVYKHLDNVTEDDYIGENYKNQTICTLLLSHDQTDFDYIEYNGVTNLELVKVIEKIINDSDYWSGVKNIFSSESIEGIKIMETLSSNPLQSLTRSGILKSKYEKKYVEKNLLDQINEQKLVNSNRRIPFKKLGLGITTYSTTKTPIDRINIIRDSLTTLRNSLVNSNLPIYVCIVVDGSYTPAHKAVLDQFSHIFQTIYRPRNGGISRAKNTCLSMMMENNCDLFCLADDDMIYQNGWDKYIKFTMDTVQMNYVSWVPLTYKHHNVSVNGVTVRKIIGDAFFGCFIVMTRKTVETIGLMPVLTTRYGWEHIIHLVMARKNNLIDGNYALGDMTMFLRLNEKSMSIRSISEDERKEMISVHASHPMMTDYIKLLY